MRLQELDVLRGIASLSVVIFHYTFKFREEYGHNFSPAYDWKYGHYGVQLFFVISGFVIFLSLHNVKSVGDFAYKRFTRLYPAYWICLILSFCVLTIFGLPGREVTVPQALVNLTMFQGLFLVKNVDGAYWSLWPELLFYGLMATLFYFRLINKMRVVGFTWLALCLINAFHPLHYINVFLNLVYGMFFLAGILFYNVRFRISNIVDHLGIALCYATALVVNPKSDSIVATTLIFFLFYLFAYNKLQFLCTKPLMFLGAVSYPLYLIHQNIGFILIRNLKGFIESDLIIICVVLPIIIFLAWIITAYLEKPVMAALRKRSIITQKEQIQVST